MENWWNKQNGTFSTSSNLALTTNFGGPNTVNYSRNWIPNVQNFYTTTNMFPNVLHTKTVNTFIESFTQLTESIITNCVNNPSCQNNCTSNYRTITHYCNTRCIDQYTNPFLNQSFNFVMVPNNLRNNQKQYINQDVKRPQTDVQWNSLNSNLNFPASDFKTVEGLSVCNKNVERDNVKKYNARAVQECMNQYYDNTNPYCCEFCRILDRITSKRALNLYDQCLLLKKFPTNPYELTNGIKMILSWPKNKVELNNLSDLDGLTAFYLDEHKRKMKDLFPSVDLSGNTNNCMINGCNCRHYAMAFVASGELRRAATATVVPSSAENYNLKINDPFFGKVQHELPTSEENVRRRIAELASLSALNNIRWNLELLKIHRFWEKERAARMTYAQNFGNITENVTRGEAENLSYTCDQISEQQLQELQEILLRRAQMKPRNRM